jgi:hypothetical protein
MMRAITRMMTSSGMPIDPNIANSRAKARAGRAHAV